jgi:hypothetical protein
MIPRNFTLKSQEMISEFSLKMSREREGSAIIVSQATHCKHSDEKNSMGPMNQIISWAGGARGGTIKQVSGLVGVLFNMLEHHILLVKEKRNGP